MNENYSYLFTCSLCCLYPIAFHLGMLWITKRAKQIDWDNIRFPWRKQ